MTKPEINPTQADQVSVTLTTECEQTEFEAKSSTISPGSRISGFANELVSAKNITRATLVGATLAALAFEQSPGNEAVRAALAFNALENTDSAVLAGTVVAGATMAIEGGTSTVVALGLHQEQKTVRRIVGRFQKNSAPELDEEGNTVEKPRTLSTEAGDLALAVGIGPAIAMTKRHIQDAKPTLRSDIRRGLSYSAVGATVSGGIGYLVTGGVQHAEAIGMEKPAEYVVEYGADLRFWGGVLGVIYGAKAINKVVSKVKTAQQGSSE